MRIAVCDDELTIREHIIDVIRQKWEFTHYVHTFSSGEDLMEFYQQGNEPFDILLLDIVMKDKSGIDVAKFIRKRDSSAIIIFITAATEHWQEGYNVEAYQFLVKPFSREHFYSVLSGAMDKVASRTATVLIRIDKEYRREISNDILYIESYEKSLIFYLHNREPIKTIGSLKQYIYALENHGFVQIFASYLVNLQYIVSIDQKKRLAVMRNGVSLPIARERMQEVLKKYLEYARG